MMDISLTFVDPSVEASGPSTVVMWWHAAVTSRHTQISHVCATTGCVQQSTFLPVILPNVDRYSK